MRTENSFGIIPVKRVQDEWKVLLIQPHKGWWGIPKGHANPGEDKRDAAERELFEETGLKIVRYLSKTPLYERYKFTASGKLIDKTVTYFICEVKGKVVLQQEELINFQWVSLSSSETHATYPETKRVLCEAKAILGEME